DLVMRPLEVAHLLSSVGVPEKGVPATAAGDQLAVRREGDTVDRLVALDAPQLLAGGRFPPTHRLIVPAGDKPLAVRREGTTARAARVGRDRAPLHPLVGVPDSHGPVGPC